MPDPDTALPQQRAPRRFAVEPVETSITSSRSRRQAATAKDDESTLPRRRFAPQLEETITRSSRSPRTTGDAQAKQNAGDAAKSSSKRQFSPNLVETTSRSRRTSDATPSIRQADKTDLLSGDRTHLPRYARPSSSHGKQARSALTRLNIADSDGTGRESRFSAASLSRRSSRRASFQVPHLEAISSPDGSDGTRESALPSLATSPSSASDANESRSGGRLSNHDHGNKAFEGYCQALSLETAQSVLKARLLVAFPNESSYQPVDHFFSDQDASPGSAQIDYQQLVHDDIPDLLCRRESGIMWDVAELRKSKAMSRARRLRQEPVLPTTAHYSHHAGAESESSASSPKFAEFRGFDIEQNEVKKMRNAAAPPMLGSDISFVKSLSPQNTQLINPSSEPVAADSLGFSTDPGLWSLAQAQACHKCLLQNSGGLWPGICTCPTTSRERKPSECCDSSNREIRKPPDAATSSNRLLFAAATSDEMSEELCDEFPDSFVTQVYNYLSLGYPALAQSYDAELSSISGFSIPQLRNQEHHTDPAIGSRAIGFIGLAERSSLGDGSSSSGGITWEGTGQPEKCPRWQALRHYVDAWARVYGHGETRSQDEAQWPSSSRMRKGSWAG